MTQGDEIKITPMLLNHAEQVAGLHIEGIPSGFISSLGSGFVVALYEGIAESKYGYGFVAKKNGRVIGFTAFTTNLGALYWSVILSHGLKFMVSLARQMLSWSKARKTIETLFYPARIKRMKLPSAELLSVVISEEARRGGLATELMRAGFIEAIRRDINKLKILCAADIKAGNKLYEKLGFKLIGQIDNHGVVSNVYVANTDYFKHRDTTLEQPIPKPQMTDVLANHNQTAQQSRVLQVRDMRLEDLNDVASVHKYCFPNSIFSLLDDSLVKCFYGQAIEEPYSYAVVLEDTGNRRIAGFAIGTMRDGFRKRLIKRHPFVCFFSIIKGLLTNAAIWRAVIKRLLSIKKTLSEKPKVKVVGPDIPPAKGPEAVFMPIAVHTDYRGNRNANRLAEHFTRKLFDAGAARVRGRIASDNVASVILFKSLGWQYRRTCEGWFTTWLDRPEQPEVKPGLSVRAGDFITVTNHEAALVTYGWCRTSYAVALSLGRRGIDVHVADASSLAASRFSRYCKSFTKIPDLFLEPDKYFDETCLAIKKTGARVLLPAHDGIGVLSRRQDELPKGVCIAVPDWESYRIAEDKFAAIDLASGVGCPTPLTTRVESWSHLENLSQLTDWPVVIKTHIGNSAKGVRIAHNRDEFLAKFKWLVDNFNLPQDRWPCVQEFLPGDAVGVCVLYDHGKCVASFAERYLRCKEPGKFGTSTFRESLVDPKLVSNATVVMDKLHWHGVAHLDFIADKNGQYRLIEINPRLWGALALSIFAGVDFPYLWYQVALGKPVDNLSPSGYKSIKCRWVVGDCMAFLERLRHGRFSEALKILQPEWGCYHDDFVLTDPMPFIFEIADYATKFIKAGGRTVNPVTEGMVR